MLLRHGICCMDMGHVFLWEKNMSSCWTRIYGVFLLEKNTWCLLVGEEYMAMEDEYMDMSSAEKLHGVHFMQSRLPHRMGPHRKTGWEFKMIL